MTIKQIDTFKVKGKRKEHPMARKYPGRPSMEMTQALQKFYDDLDDSEKEWFLKGTLVFEEAVVAPFFDALQEGDVIGLGLVKGYEEFDTTHPSALRFKIVKVYEGEDRIRVQNVSFEKYPEMKHTLLQETDLCFEEISWGFGCGMADILERSGKMFGVSEEMEYEVVIMGKETDVSGSVTGSTSTPAALPINKEDDSV
jgi:hypothetical protein